ncbi:807_t:CDS:2 [Entrophospora sp. SA101]|nr:15916_t:CDS:2 [Entrophospora sp. SA101]CAJ0753092.1 2387_t:CDS:2 [Entrophospora sp. SA101]CAJ0755009.1 807_t:CDS:2 [Entrophospora sp. SA101]
MASYIKEKDNALFPNCTAPFVFDNSRSHDSYKGNALIANRINLGPGGKHEKYNFWADNKLQPMISEDGAPKGMREWISEALNSVDLIKLENLQGKRGDI